MERKTESSKASLALALLCAAALAHASGAHAGGPPAPVNWDAEAIAASHVVHADPAHRPPHPVFRADPRTLTLVIEAATIILLDETLAPIARIAPQGLHGAPAFSPDGRFVYWASHDGWVNQFDLATLAPVARIRVGSRPRNLAVASNGRYVMVANAAPATLVALDARDLSLVKVAPGADKTGRPSPFSAVVDAPRRNAFVVALTDAPELWEIPYDGRPVYKGLVHDYRLKEAIAEPGPLPARVIALDTPLADFAFTPEHDVVFGFPHGATRADVIHLGVGRKITEIAFGRASSCVAATSWARRDAGATQRLIALRAVEGLAAVDASKWKSIATVRTGGSGCLVRGHDRSPYLWVDAAGTGIELVDTQRLEVVAALRPGGPVSDIAFDRDGRHVMVSTQGADAALVVYDAQTRAEIKRLPLDAPAGIHNVWNASPRPAGSRH